VAIVTMNSNKANFVNAKFVDDFEAALNRLENEPALKDKAVVLTGHGKAFSAGFDLRMILSGDFRPTVGKYGICVLRLLNLGRPTIAAINGHCFAAGMITALCCDRLVALDSDYKFGLSEVHLGISLPALGVELCRLKMDPRTVMKSLVFGMYFVKDGYFEATCN
jgi:enoyl-CoA hydratase